LGRGNISMIFFKNWEYFFKNSPKMMGVAFINFFTPTQGVSFGHEAWIYLPHV
jgi:hypothetical protein